MSHNSPLPCTPGRGDGGEGFLPGEVRPPHPNPSPLGGEGLWSTSFQKSGTTSLLARVARAATTAGDTPASSVRTEPSAKAMFAPLLWKPKICPVPSVPKFTGDV